MYDEEEKWETLKKILKLVADEIIDQIGPPKYLIKLLRFNFYKKHNLIDKVQFVSWLWKGYILFLGVLIFFINLISKRREISFFGRDVWLFCNLEFLIFFILFRIVMCAWVGEREGKIWKREKQGNPNKAFEPEHCTQQWFLKEKYNKFRGFCFWGMFFWVCVVVICYYWFEYVPNSAYFYPVIFLIPFYEMWIQYSWWTENEYYEAKLHITPVKRHMKSPVIMKIELDSLLPGACLTYNSYTEKPEEVSLKEFEEILSGDLYEENILRAFYEKRKDIRHKGLGLAKSALELLRGHSVLFRTPFYKDMDYAFLLSAYLKLARGQTILLVCAVETAPWEMLDWIQNEMRKMNGMNWWGFQIYEAFRKPEHAVVVCHTDFQAFFEDTDYKEFRDNLGMIFLQEPDEYSTKCYRMIRSLCSEKELGKDLCIAVNSAKMETLDMINWGFGESSVCSGQLWRPAKTMQAIYWKEEVTGSNEVNGPKWGIEEKLLRYMLGELQTETIIWIGGCMLALWDVLWAYRRYCDIEIGDRVISEEYGYGLLMNQEAYIIAEDFLGNYWKTADYLISRGIEKTVIHVIVPNYLLRDYMLDNFQDFLVREGISGERPDSLRNKVYDIFGLLAEEWVPVEKLKHTLQSFRTFSGNWIEDLEKLLSQCIFGKTDGIKLEKRFIKEECYRIYPEQQITDALKKEKALGFYVEYEDELLNMHTDLTYNTVFQKHLPGQNLILGNKSYEFMGIMEKSEKYLIKLKRYSRMVEGKTYYRQLREYELREEKLMEPERIYPGSSIQAEWRYGEADIIVNTLAYLSMKEFWDIENAMIVKCKDVPKRRYSRKQYLLVVFKGADDKAVREKATWLKEAFYTLCHKEADYLTVCLQECYDSASICPLKSSCPQETGNKYIYIIEDRNEDSGILQAIYEKQNSIIKTMDNYEKYQNKAGTSFDALQKFLNSVDWRIK